MVAKLHNSINADEGKLDIVINRQSIFDDSINFISNLDAETLTRRLFVKFINEPVSLIKKCSKEGQILIYIGTWLWRDESRMVLRALKLLCR